jgi:signal transduction histidine kinase
MKLRNKLSLRSTLVFACTLCLVCTGTYVLFRQYTQQLYNKKLQERVRLAADYYLEKDEVSDKTYKEIEARFRRITNESIRLYHAHSDSLYIDDSLAFKIPEHKLRLVNEAQDFLSFRAQDRQAVGMFYHDNQGDFVIVASGIDKNGAAQLAALARMLILSCVLGLLVHYLLTQVLARKTFRPFNDLVDQVNAIKSDRLDMRLDYPQHQQDEITALVAAFNYFLQRLENTMMIQRNFLKHASHELKTPLAVLIGDIEVSLQQPRNKEEYEATLRRLRREGLHLKSITEALLMLSSFELPAQYQMAPIRIDELLWLVLDKKQIEYPEARLGVDFDFQPEKEALLSFQANKDLLFVALSNLTDNALKFSGSKPVRIRLYMADNMLHLSIADQGPGIPASEQQRIFELFYRDTRRTDVSGYGIGLYLTRQILDLHKIKLKIDSEPGQGTLMTLSFPS